jgi:hypothetical protein
MPEASVYEQRDLPPSERCIWSNSPASERNRVLDSESEASAVKGRANREFRDRAGPAITFADMSRCS